MSWPYCEDMLDMDDSENYCKPSTVIEQFVKRVENFSSQYGSEISVSYTALNLRGPPSNFPDYGDYPQAFVMRTYGKWWEEAPSATDEYCPQNQKVISSQDFIEVSFETKVYPMEVSIFETYNPGALVRIWAWGHDVIKQVEPTWILLWEGEPQDIGETPRVFTPPIKEIYIPIRVLRLEFNHRLLPYYTELDAVLLRGKVPAIPDPYITSDEKYNAFFELPRMEKGEILKKVLSSNLTAMDCEYLLRKDQEEAHMGPPQGYFQNLPDETILSILKYLDLKSLCRVAQVNRHFNRLASDSVLYKRIDLRPYWNCVRPGLLQMLSYRCKILNKFDISWCGGRHMLQGQDIAKFIMKRSAALTHLRMNCCLFVNNTVFDSISFAVNLQELCLRSVTNDKIQWSYLSNLSKLKRLDLYRSSIHTMATIAIIMRNPELEHINLGSCRSISAMNEVVYALGRNCRNLISADFWKSYSLTAVGLRELANCSNLQELDVGWCLQAGMSGEWLRSLNGEPLRKLFLGALRGVSDRDLRALIARTPNLVQMDLLGVSGVTPELCNEIFETCRNLRLLDISFCDQLSHQQVSEWRQRFPQVSIKWSLQVSQTSQPHQRFLEPNFE